MKFLPKFLLVACTLGFATGAMGQDLQKLLTEGQTAFMRGDLVTAKRHFQSAEKLAPTNPTVVGFLKQIAVAEAKTPKDQGAERELSQLIIPQIQFKEATFNSALEFMKKKATELSNGKQSVNF